MKLRTTLFASVIAALLAPAMFFAQQTATPSDTKTPSAVAPSASAPAKMTREEQIKTDWPWLSRFKQDNLQLAPPAPGENRVVFMGDSITQGWHLDVSFPAKPYINRGISGQTTPQMVLRFHQDVIALKPSAVIILAGINDIAENTGPMTLEQTEDNLAAMAEMATANHIPVILCSVLPAFDFPWHPGLAPAPKVIALNQWIKAYAADKGHLYVDYYSPMKDDRNGLPSTLSKDGVHPNPAGYAVMAPLAEAAIEQAIKDGNRP